jgi:hypothetical protein
MLARKCHTQMTASGRAVYTMSLQMGACLGETTSTILGRRCRTRCAPFANLKCCLGTSKALALPGWSESLDSIRCTKFPH